TLPTHRELELATATAPLVMAEGDAVIEPEGADRQVEANAHTIVVAIPREICVIRSSANAANIVKEGDAHPNAVFLLKDRNAVFRRAEPIRVAAYGFVNGGVLVLHLPRADVAVHPRSAQYMRAGKKQFPISFRLGTTSRVWWIHGVPVLTSTPETIPLPTLLSTSHGICARTRSLPSSRMSLLAAPVTRRNTRVLSNARQPRTRAPATRSKLMAGALTGAGAAWQTTPLISSPLRPAHRLPWLCYGSPDFIPCAVRIYKVLFLHG